MAIFVVHQDHRHFGFAQNFQHIERVELVRHLFQRSHQLAQVQIIAPQLRRDNIACLDDAADFVDGVLGDGEAAVLRLHQELVNILALGVDIEPVDFGPRGHHLPDRAVGQADDAAHYRPFMFLDDAGACRFGKNHLQLVRRDVVHLLALHPHQAEDQRAAVVE